MSKSISVTSKTSYVIDLSDCIEDITDNVIHGSEHYDLPSDIFQPVIVQALNDLLDDFANNTEKYIQPCHETEIDCLAQEYKNH